MPRLFRLALLLVVAALSTPLRAQVQSARTTDSTLSQRIEFITSRPEFRHALWGMRFYDLDSGRVLYDRNAEALFTPGSTTKLLTMGTLLSTLGTDYRYRTRVYRTGPVLSDGTLNGDLVLVGSGDPNLSQRLQADGTLAFENEDHSYDGTPETRAVPGDPLVVVRKLAAQVASKIKRVRRRVLVDATLFEEGERELGTGVVISPIVVNDNLVDVTFRPGTAAGSTMQMDVSPQTAYARFVNRTQTGASKSARAVHIDSDSALPDGRRVVTFSGTLPAGGPPILYSYAVASPSAFARVAFTEALEAVGVRFDPLPRKLLAPPNFARLASLYADSNAVAEHLSAPLIEEAKVTLKVSQNLHASMAPMLLGAVIGQKDTARTGFDVEREFLTRAGLDLDGAQQGDGAGGNAHYTPAFMVGYLAYVSAQPFAKQFLAALPILGRDGTLFDIQDHSPAAGHVFAKTGTYATDDPLNRRMLVTGKGLAGYMTTVDGRRLAFAIYVNNVAVPAEAADPDGVKRVGQALGEVASVVYASSRGATP